MGQRLLITLKLSVILLLLFVLKADAQSPNDNCANASVITIPNNGFYLGTLTGTTYNISGDGIEAGESFAPAILGSGLFKKSMWYTFTIPTSRALSVTLLQPGSAIAPTDIGFSVYKTSGCLPPDSDISTKLTPIAQFGTTFHPCVDSGVYLIQVSSNNNANGPLYIQLSLADTSQSLYNFPTTAYNFGVVSNSAYCVKYPQDCLTIDSATDYCTVLKNYQNYNRSSWHTFTTGNYVDYVGIQFDDAPNYAWWVWHTPYIGLKFYQGNCKTTPVSSLTLLSQDSLCYSDKYASHYKCQLQPNTTYSFELFFPEDYYNTVQVILYAAGINASNGPQPVLSSLAASNQLGVLPLSVAGSVTNFTDYFGCNSELSTTACGTVNPAAGINYQNTHYDLSTWFTFSLAADADVNFSSGQAIGFNNGCGSHSWYPNELIRIFNQPITNSCSSLDTSNLYAQFLEYDNFVCMPPGTYSVQILGWDSAYNWYNSLDLGTLGAKATLTMTAYSVPSEKFDLSATNHFDSINKFQPLKVGVTYAGLPDTMGCANTVMPSNPSCDTAYHKAIYREFKIQDSGIVSIWYTYWWSPNNNLQQIFSGDANALATAQNVHTYPQQINGLTPITACTPTAWCTYSDQACVIPGTYTIVTTSNVVGYVGNINLSHYPARTKHYSAATVQNLGDIIDSMSVHGGSTVSSDIDSFSCMDNADTINGFAPCNSVSGQRSTKAIYRQFYLSSPSFITINDLTNYGCGYRGTLALFNGEASNGINTLKQSGSPWNCFNNASTPPCQPLPAGWYTVVAYGAGPTYGNPTSNYGNGGNDIGYPTGFSISITTSPPGPKYDRPYKACIDTLTNAPFNVPWGPKLANTAAYPETDTMYNLYTEHFNCTLDTPFSSQPIVSCGPSFNRIAYYVFNVPKESFVMILAGGYEAEVFPFDVRKDSTDMLTATPVQPCMQDNTYLQICRMQPGVYTLVIFAGNANDPGSVTPSIYVDQVGTSRFDFANKAYDFGIVPPDKNLHWGKVGDVNPLDPARAPSNDFFYCTTGSAVSDPTEPACGAQYDSAIYNNRVNNYLYNAATNPFSAWNIPRRNLWYTFVVDVPGSVHVVVKNKTPDKQYQYPFSVYSSDVSGTLPFSTVVADGLVDSTKASGLTNITDSMYYNITSNVYGGYCDGFDSITFFRNPCTTTAPTRYYVVVDNRNAYWYCGWECMAPNSQVEVAVRVDSLSAIPTKFDHYYEANNIGSNLGPGCYQGAQDNFECATLDPTDPSQSNGAWTCNKTLWYKFSTVTSGYVRRRISVNGTPMPNANYNDIELYREIIPGDSTNHGLQYVPYSNFDSAGVQWEVSCIAPGTYYLLLPGCGMNAQYVIPYICILDQSGDFCSDPVVSKVPGPGGYNASAIVDCNTIGTDYGEFGPTLSCPQGAVTSKYKSTWFRIDITSGDTMDVTVFITDNTNAGPADIEYRLMTGNCSAMQEGSCVENAQTQNTYKCLTQGSYYIQVFEPVISPETNQSVTGNIVLNINAIPHVDTCQNLKHCLATAAFTPSFNCNKSDSISITNYSTYGTSVDFLWNFGYNNDSSHEVSPVFVYPNLPYDSTYNIKLLVTNTSCGGKDSLTVPIFIPARPEVHLPGDSTLCLNGSYTLNVASFPGATYRWSNGSTDSTVTINGTGNFIYSVTVTYATCKAKSSTNLNVLSGPTVNLGPDQILCPGDSINLKAPVNNGYTYQWSNGNTNSNIWVKEGGTYWVKVNNSACSVSDTVVITGSSQFQPFTRDTSVCLGATLTLNASNPKATAYKWQDGTTSAQYVVKTAGNYWVNINWGTCETSDSITVTSIPPATSSVNAKICQGNNYMLPDGKIATTTGAYTSTLTTKKGCDSVITTHLVVNPSYTKSVNAAICQGQNYTRPGGKTIAIQGNYIDTLTTNSGCDSIITTNLTINPVYAITVNDTICHGQNYTLPGGKEVTAAGTYTSTLTAKTGCDSVITTLLIVNPVYAIAVNANICQGQNYTLPGGKVVNASGTYTSTLTAKNGCDSVITTTLTVNPGFTITANPQICHGQSYTLPSGLTVSFAGVYIDTLHSVNGCDSIITTNLSFSPLLRSTTNDSICPGKNYTLPGGTVVSAAGSYIDTVHTLGGCDSVITTNLSIIKPYRNTTAISICTGQSYTLPGGSAVSAPGTYIDTLKLASGCDSIITTNLSLTPPLRSTTNDSICNGKNYTLPGGTVVSAAGRYIDTIRTSGGCDSIITTNLSIIKPYRNSIAVSICTGQSYTLPNGSTVSVAGAYIDTVQLASGCDSIITTNLSFNPALQSTAVVSICTGRTYTLPGGSVVSAAGTYVDTVLTSGGCDSIITTTISIDTVTLSVTHVDATCELANGKISVTINKGVSPFSYLWNNGNTTSDLIALLPGKYLVTVTDKDNCYLSDSAQLENIGDKPTVNVKVSPLDGCEPLTVQISNQPPDTLSYNWYFGDGTVDSSASPTHTYQTAGKYQIELIAVNKAGCIDSLTNAALIEVYGLPKAYFTIDPAIIKDSIDLSRATFTFNNQSNGGANYYWDFGDSTSSTSFDATHMYAALGSYTVKLIVTNSDGCIDTFSLGPLVIIPDGQVFMPNVFTPNGDGLNDVFQAYGKSIETVDLTIYDRWGECLFKSTANEGWDGTFNGQKMNTGVYVYVARVKFIDGKETVLKGDVTLFR